MIQALPMSQELFLFRIQVRTTDLRGLGDMSWRLVGPWVLQMVLEPTLGTPEVYARDLRSTRRSILTPWA